MSRNRTAARFTTLVVLGLLTGPGPAAAAETAVSVPMELTRTRHIVVNVKINETGPYRLVFDTGSPLTFIGGKAAQKAGLITAERAKQPAFFGMRGQFTVKRLQLGDIDLSNFGLMVLDHPVIDLLSQYEGQIDGIVGYSFFSRYRTTLDYQQGTISFVPVTYQPQDVMSGLIGRMFSQSATATPIILSVPALWGVQVDRPDESPGVRVTRVFAESAAAAAGLKVGDRIMTLDGRWTDSSEDLQSASADVKPGTIAELAVRRGDKELVLQVRPRVGI